MPQKTTASLVNFPNGSDTFNFYAAGDAPNYFRGVVSCSGVQGANLPDVNTQTQEGTYLTPYGQFVSTANGGSDSLANILVQTTSTNPTRTLAIFYDRAPNAGGNIVGRITHDGANTSYVETSDHRVKENIAPLASAADRVKALNPVTFNYTTANPDKTYEGFIAHELQEQAPLAVVGEKDAVEPIGTLLDWDGTELETEVIEPSAEELTYTEEVETDGVAQMITRTRSWNATGTRDVYQGVDQTKLIPMLTKALQEALDKIETLETRLSDAGIA